MAASAWKLFKGAKKALGQGSIAMNSGNFKLVLVKDGATLPSAATDATTWASLKTDGVTEVTEGGGYSSSGEALVSPEWTFSGNNVKFDATNFSLSVTADLSAIRAAIIRQSSGDNLLCYASLSSVSFDLSSGNKLTITMAASGIFALQ